MKLTHIILITMLGILISEPLKAQVQRSMSFDASTSFMLRELSAMIVQNESGLEVEMIMGGNDQNSDPMSDQLNRGDMILMMNGKRVSEVAMMREIYKSLAEGEEVKVGVRRGDERFIVGAKKGEVPENSGGQMVLSFDIGDGAPPTIIPELGVLLTTNDQGIEIMSVLEPLQPVELQGEELESYFIASINDRTFDNPDKVQHYLSSLEIGDTIILVIEKDGTQKTLELKKQEPHGNVRMSIDN